MLKVVSDDCFIELGAHSYNWDIASGGAPLPTPVADLGPVEAVTLLYPLPVDTVEVTSRQIEPDGQCPGPINTWKVEKKADGTRTATPTGPGGPQRVVVAVTSAKGGARYAFDMTALPHGDNPAPVANLVVGTSFGTVDISGQTFLENLPDRGATITETVTITAADGTVTRAVPELLDASTHCLDGEPLVMFGRNPRDAVPGPAPYRFDVTLTIDGTEYRAAATWSGGEATGKSVLATLDFSPPLPR